MTQTPAPETTQVSDLDRDSRLRALTFYVQDRKQAQGLLDTLCEKPKKEGDGARHPIPRFVREEAPTFYLMREIAEHPWEDVVAAMVAEYPAFPAVPSTNQFHALRRKLCDRWPVITPDVVNHLNGRGLHLHGVNFSGSARSAWESAVTEAAKFGELPTLESIVDTYTSPDEIADIITRDMPDSPTPCVRAIVEEIDVFTAKGRKTRAKVTCLTRGIVSVELWGGENMIVISYMTMQNGQVDVSAMFSCIDSASWSGVWWFNTREVHEVAHRHGVGPGTRTRVHGALKAQALWVMTMQAIVEEFRAEVPLAKDSVSDLGLVIGRALQGDTDLW